MAKRRLVLQTIAGEQRLGGFPPYEVTPSTGRLVELISVFQSLIDTYGPTVSLDSSYDDDYGCYTSRFTYLRPETDGERRARIMKRVFDRARVRRERYEREQLNKYLAWKQPPAIYLLPPVGR